MANNIKTSMVVGLFPEQYKVIDTRLNKPVCFQKIDGGEISGSMLVQDLDTVKVDKNKEISYFCPNNIAILLSVSSKSIEKAKSLYSEVSDHPVVGFEFNTI